MHYAELNPDKIESGHFRYHLTQLVREGYIDTKRRGVYELSPAGKRFVDKLSEHSINASPMPKVITYTLLTDNDMLILQEKQKEPYLHLINMIGGKLHFGETSAQAAAREVEEKTGVTIKPPELAGIFEILIRNNKEIYTHVIAYVHQAQVNANAFAASPVKIVRAEDLPSTPDIAPDFLPVFSEMQRNSGPCIQTLLLDL